MKDKLRELVNRISEQEVSASGTCAVSKEQLAELLAILDAEGDCGAVGEALKLQAQIHAQEARTANATIAEIYKLCTGSTGEPGNWHGAEPVRALIAERDALLAAATYPARSGVVSDEDVEAACRKYYNCGHPVYPPVFEGIRAALEHFAKGERHERTPEIFEGTHKKLNDLSIRDHD